MESIIAEEGGNLGREEVETVTLAGGGRGRQGVGLGTADSRLESSTYLQF